MKSGLGDRNNNVEGRCEARRLFCLNEVRSWRPEQFDDLVEWLEHLANVSMKSGLGDRNN